MQIKTGENAPAGEIVNDDVLAEPRLCLDFIVKEKKNAVLVRYFYYMMLRAKSKKKPATEENERIGCGWFTGRIIENTAGL